MPLEPQQQLLLNALQTQIFVAEIILLLVLLAVQNVVPTITYSVQTNFNFQIIFVSVSLQHLNVEMLLEQTPLQMLNVLQTQILAVEILLLVLPVNLSVVQAIISSVQAAP